MPPVDPNTDQVEHNPNDGDRPTSGLPFEYPDWLSQDAANFAHHVYERGFEASLDIGFACLALSKRTILQQNVETLNTVRLLLDTVQRSEAVMTHLQSREALIQSKAIVRDLLHTHPSVTEELAAEFIQETAISTLKAPYTVRHPKQHLRQSIRYQAARKIETDKRRPQSLGEMIELAVAQTDTASQEELLDYILSQVTLRDIERRALRMICLQGYNYQKIAEQEEVMPATMASILSRLRDKLLAAPNLQGFWDEIYRKRDRKE